MADYKVGDLANLISSIRHSTETPNNDLFTKKKKNKKRSVENEVEIVANGKEAVASSDIKKKKKKKHSEEVVSEEPVSNTVTITAVTRNGVDEGSHKKKKKRKHGEEENVEEKQSETTVTVVASNDTQEPQKKKKKKKHKENIEETEEIEATITVVTADSIQEPQKKKKKKKHKENIEAEEEENKATVTVVTADSDKPSAEKGVKKRNRKKKKSVATKTDAVSTEKGTDNPGKINPSVNGEAKAKGNTPSSQDIEAIRNKKKLKKKKRMQLKKLKNATEREQAKTGTDNTSTFTLENKDKKDKSKKDLKQEKIKERKIQSLPTQHPDAEVRTIFIGNVNMETKRKELKSVFSKYGKVEAVRIRGVAVGEQGMLKKVAHVTGQMHPSRSSVTAYVRFESTDSVTAALEANGMVLREHHLNIDRAVNEAKRELRNSVFVGNLPWEAEDEQLYQHFQACGDIDRVRIVRDKQLNSGKGFGYVNFKSSDATEVALQLTGKMFMNRPLRVVRCTKKPKKEKVNDDNSTKKSNMKLDFMKRNNNLKPKHNQQTKEKTPNESEFSGAKTAELGKNKKIKKPRWNKEDRKKSAVASLLTGDKSVVQRPKFTAKKGGGKPTGKPIAKKFGGKPGGNFGGKPGGNFGGKPGGNFGGKPGGNFGGKPGGNFGGKPGGKFGGKPGGKFGGKPFAGKPGAGK